MLRIYKNTKIVCFLFIIIISLSSCPGLFKDTEYCIIDNKSDYTIDIFVDNTIEGTVTSGNIYKFGLYTDQTYSIKCTSGNIQWGPRNIKLTKGEPYTWTINNPPEPTPTPIIEPTPEPTPLPQANITINNYTDFIIILFINELTKGSIDPGNSAIYLEEIGNYLLFAYPQDGLTGYWYNNINLDVEGYTWNLETNTELYPSENCQVWDFENNYDDHLGIYDWTNKYSTLAFSSDIKKINNYSLTANSGEHADISKYDSICGDSLSRGFWCYFDITNGENEGEKDWSLIMVICSYPYSYINVYYRKSAYTNDIKIILKVQKDGSHASVTLEDNQLLQNAAWHYISYSYNKTTDIIYLTVDDRIIASDVLGGTWSSLPLTTILRLKNNYSHFGLNTIYVDEFIMFATEFIDPHIFVNHYIHDVPWGVVYIP